MLLYLVLLLSRTANKPVLYLPGEAISNFQSCRYANVLNKTAGNGRAGQCLHFQKREGEGSLLSSQFRPIFSRSFKALHIPSSFHTLPCGLSCSHSLPQPSLSSTRPLLPDSAFSACALSARKPLGPPFSSLLTPCPLTRVHLGPPTLHASPDHGEESGSASQPGISSLSQSSSQCSEVLMG